MEEGPETFTQTPKVTGANEDWVGRDAEDGEDGEGGEFYPGVLLPPKAVEKLGWESGNQIFVNIQKEQVSSEEISRVELSGLPSGISEDHPQSYKLRERGENYLVRFPKEWIKDENQEVYFDAEKDSDLFVEVKQVGDSSSLLVYNIRDYSLRVIKNVERGQPSVLRSTLAALGIIEEWKVSEVLDLSGAYEGQKFRIVPFEFRHPVFLSDDDSGSVKGHTAPKMDHFERLDRPEEVPNTKASKIEIRWSADFLRYHLLFKDSEALSLIHTETYTKGFEVVLPEKSTFHFTAYTRYGIETTSVRIASMLDSDEDYQGMYCIEEDDVVIVYVPCKTERAKQSTPVNDNDYWSDRG